MPLLMHKGLFQLRRLVSSQSPVSWFFLASFLFVAWLLVAAFKLDKPSLNPTDTVTLAVGLLMGAGGLLTGAVVWWQGYLITKQMVLNAVTDLYKEWNSEEMLEKRRLAWSNGNPNPHTIEDVLEFLEKVSSLEKKRFITRQLIWDTFGWYIGRYYFYCKPEIQKLRTKWTPKGDPTLYQDLERLYPLLLALEVQQRNLKRTTGTELLTKGAIETEYEQTRNMFVSYEMSDNGKDD